MREPPADSDILWGVDAIAAVIGREKAATYHLLSKGALPAKRVGGRWVASKARLIAFLTDPDPAQAK